MSKKFPTHPAHPERICWGCHKHCSVNAMDCGNGTERAQHPVELFGDDWLEFGNDEVDPSNKTGQTPVLFSTGKHV